MISLPSVSKRQTHLFHLPKASIPSNVSYCAYGTSKVQEKRIFMNVNVYSNWQFHASESWIQLKNVIFHVSRKVQKSAVKPSRLSNFDRFKDFKWSKIVFRDF